MAASLEFTVAKGAGMRRQGGGSLTIADFLPKFAQEPDNDPKAKEEKLKAKFRALARRGTNKAHGTE